MIVRKFGGSSVGSPGRMKNVFELANAGDERQLVVLSAIGGVTDTLVKIYEMKSEQLIEELRVFYHDFVFDLIHDGAIRKRANAYVEESLTKVRAALALENQAAVLAEGEYVSTYFFHSLAADQGVSAGLLDSAELLQLDQEGNIALNHLSLRMEAVLRDEHSFLVAQGFICRDHNGEMSNLKRGGSDYSASLFGAALGVERIEIWSDIDGVHNNDPRYVDNTHSIAEMSYNEAAEMAYFGAKVLHPSTLLPARECEIPVLLKNTMKPAQRGTRIHSFVAERGIRAIAAKDGITALRIRSDRMLMAYGFLSKVFDVFSRYRTPIDMITTSEVAVSMTIDDTSRLDEIVEALSVYGHVDIEHQQCIVSVIGRMEMSDSGYGRQIFDALEHIPVRMISYGASQNNVSLVVNSSDKVTALNALHQALFINPASSD